MKINHEGREASRRELDNLVDIAWMIGTFFYCFFEKYANK